jgi:hypothetical protein
MGGGCATAVLQTNALSRGKAMIREILGEGVPADSLADRFAAQNGHIDSQQLCFAHQLRDAQYTVNADVRSALDTVPLYGLSALPAIRRVPAGHTVSLPAVAYQPRGRE